MDNPITGETPIDLGGQEYTLHFTWRELVEVKKQIGKDTDLFDPETLAPLLVIGLRRHHPEINEDFIYDKSPPLTRAIMAVNRALTRSYVGEDAPAEGQQNPLARAMDMIQTATGSTASPEPSSTPTELESAPASSGS